MKTLTVGYPSPDFSNNFFAVGNLPEENGSYLVDNVSYLVEQAENWKNYKGDYYDPETEAKEKEIGVERLVFLY